MGLFFKCKNISVTNLDFVGRDETLGALFKKICNKNYKYNIIYESDYYLEWEHNIPINLLQDLQDLSL